MMSDFERLIMINLTRSGAVLGQQACKLVYDHEQRPFAVPIRSNPEDKDQLQHRLELSPDGIPANPDNPNPLWYGWNVELP